MHIVDREESEPQKPAVEYLIKSADTMIGAKWVDSVPGQPGVYCGGSSRPEESSLIFAYSCVGAGPDSTIVMEEQGAHTVMDAKPRSIILLEEWGTESITKIGYNSVPIKRRAISIHDGLIKTVESEQAVPVLNLDGVTERLLNRRCTNLKMAVMAGTFEITVGKITENDLAQITRISDLDEDWLKRLGNKLLDFL